VLCNACDIIPTKRWQTFSAEGSFRLDLLVLP
jgi:hypothetical protein